MKYSIYIFSVYNSATQLTSISQVYAKGQIRGFMALGLIMNVCDCDIDYISKEDSCRPIEWELETLTSINN